MQNEKTAYGLGKILSNETINKGLLSKVCNIFNSMTITKTSKQFNKNMGRRPKQTLLQRKHTDGQQVPGKLLNITNY